MYKNKKFILRSISLIASSVVLIHSSFVNSTYQTLHADDELNGCGHLYERKVRRSQLPTGSLQRFNPICPMLNGPISTMLKFVNKGDPLTIILTYILNVEGTNTLLSL